MCKENALVHRVGVAVVESNRAANAKGNYRVMRKNKTRKDHESGAWANTISNKSQRAEENRR